MADRNDMLTAISSPKGIDLSPDSGHIDLSPDFSAPSGDSSNIWGIDVQVPAPRPKGGGGFLGPIGKLIDIVDTPRAALVSTAKEMTDLLQGEGFSPTDWWNQTSDNYMVGQFMQDEGWGTGTAWDIAIGLPFDIALDPLTYLTGGAGAAARLGNWNKTSKALREAAKVADKAGDFAKAQKLNAASLRVSKNRSVLAGGDELAEIGLNPKGMGFTAPGTGRLGRKIIEPGLNKLTGGRFSAWANARRIKQIPKYLIDDVAFDLASTSARGLKNQEKVFDAMKLLKEGKSVKKVDDAVLQAAKLAGSMAVDIGFTLGKGSAKIGRTFAMGPGRLFNTAIAKTPYLRNVALALGGDANHLKMASRGFATDGSKLTDGEMLVFMQSWDNLDVAKTAQRGFDVEFGMAAARTREGIEQINSQIVAGGGTALTPEDLMVLSRTVPAEEMTPQQLVASGIGSVNSSTAKAQKTAQEFWESARQKFNAALGEGEEPYGSIGEMIDEFYAASYLDLDVPAAQITGGNRNSWQAPLPESGRIKGSPLQQRIYGMQKGQTSKFLGEDLVLPKDHPKGWGIQEQMVDIGKRSQELGSDFQNMFKQDFWEVTARYGRDLSRRVRHQRWFNENVHAGIINRATAVKGGVRFQRDVAQGAQDLVEKAQNNSVKWQKRLGRGRGAVEKARRTAVQSRPGQEEELVGIQNLLVRLNNEGREISKIANGLEEALGVTELTDEARAVIVQIANGTFDAANATTPIAGKVAQEVISVIEPAQQRLSLLRQVQRQLQTATDQATAMGAPGGTQSWQVAAEMDDVQIARFLTKLDREISELEEVFTAFNRGLMRGMENSDEVVVMKQVVKLTDDINNPKYPISYTTTRMAGPRTTLQQTRKMSPERAESLRDVRTTKQPQTAQKQRREAGRFATGEEPVLRDEWAPSEMALSTPPTTRHTVQTPNETFHVDRYISPTADGKLGWQITGEGLEAGHPMAGGSKIYDDLGEALDDVYGELGYVKTQDRLPNGRYGGKYFVREVQVPKDSPLWRTKSGQQWVNRVQKMGRLSNQLDAEALIVGREIDDAEDYIRGLTRELDGSEAVIGLQDEIARLRAYNDAQQGTRHWFYELVEQAPPRVKGEASAWPAASRKIWRNPDGTQRTIYDVGQELGLDDATIARRYVDQQSRVVKTRGPKQVQSKKTIKGQKKGRKEAFEGVVSPETRLGPRAFKDDLQRIVRNVEDDMPWKQFDTERIGYFTSRGQTVPHIVTDIEDKMAHLLKVYNRVQSKIDEAAENAGAVKDRIIAAEQRVDLKQAELDDIRSEIWIERAAQQAQQLQIQAEVQQLRTSGSVDDWLRTAATDDEAIVAVMKSRATYGNFLDAYGETQSNFMNSYMNLEKRLTPGGTNYAVGGLSPAAMETMEAAITAGAKLADFGEVTKFRAQYRAVANWWKAQAVSTPGFILRNLMGGLWLNSAIAGVEMGTHSKIVGMAKAASRVQGANGNVLEGARILAMGDTRIPLEGIAGLGGARKANPHDFQMFSELLESGAVGSGQSWSEIGGAVGGSLAPYQRATITAEAGEQVVKHRSGFGMAASDPASRWSPLSADFKGFAGVRMQNERAEFMLRAAIGFDTISKGGNTVDALRQINKYHFDYSDLTKTERHIKDVIPFYTWQKNVIPVLLESMGKRPEAWANLLRAKKELELHSPQEGLVPDYFGENLGIRMPFKVPGIRGGRIYAMPDLPFKNLATFAKEPTSPIRVPLESAFPWIKMPVEIWAKKQSFADIPFSGRYQQVPSWGKIPGMMPALQALGKAKKANDGTWMMRDNDIYAVDQFSPVLGRMRRLLPNESAKQRRLAQTWISTMFGGGFRTNDAWEKQSQLIRDNTSFANDFRDVLDIETRRV
jgi:hypothetical protein